ncbi:MAG: helix-turn-helix domain-containing protein [bacterium]
MKLYTLGETANLLRVSRSTLLRLIKGQKLKTCNIGPRLVRVEEAEIIRYLRASGFMLPEACPSSDANQNPGNATPASGGM